jgi:hypothetical protein
MKRIYYVLVALILTLPTLAGEPAPVRVAMLEAIETETVEAEAMRMEDKLDSAILYYLAGSKRHPMAKWDNREALIKDLIVAGNEYGVSPYLLLTTAFYESSLLISAVGTRGEIGLTQVHGDAKKECELDTQLGQLMCGARWLKKAHDVCGYWPGALTMYATGECRSKSERVVRLVHFRMEKWQYVENLTN